MIICMSTTVEVTGLGRISSDEPRWMAHRVLDKNQPYHVGVTALMQENRTGVVLLPRDVAVYLAVLERTNSTTGRCSYSQAALSREIGMAANYITQSVSRLKRAGVLLNLYDSTSGERAFLLNPSLAWCGTGKKRSALEQQWKDAQAQTDEGW